MGKRSDFKRVERDYYPTPLAAVKPLLPHLPENILFGEPCAGDGRLIQHIEQNSSCRCVFSSDIEPMADNVVKLDALSLTYNHLKDCDFIITNPPWGRKLLHPMISHFTQFAPTWLLFDADWIHTAQSSEYVKHYLTKVVSIGRVKWIEGSKNTGKDNCCWYLFTDTKPYGQPAQFYGR